MKMFPALAVAVGMSWVVASHAAVLCQRKSSGVVVVRAGACKKKTEVPLDLAQFGAQGAPGSPGLPGLQGAPGSPDTPDQVRAKFFAGTACPGNDPADVMVRVGNICVDVYEASVWSGPTGGTQYGVVSGNYPCSANGNDCTNIYARSVAGVQPSRFIDWFQAAQACRAAGKRLLTNAEWQDAAAGTPDPGDADDGSTTCATKSPDVVATGSRPGCRSNWGAFDMVGNLNEWVADWAPIAEDCVQGGWSGVLASTNDVVCVNPSGSNIPAAWKRGGTVFGSGNAGVFALSGDYAPTFADVVSGFRCAR